MSIQVQCPKCSKKYKLPEKLAGKKFRCKKCEEPISVPAAGQEEAPADDELDLGSLDLAQEERKARAYKKRPTDLEDTKPKKSTEETIDHEQTDIMLGNLMKFAGILIAAQLTSFGILWFLRWMQWTDYIKFFFYVYRLTGGLTVLSGLGAILGSVIWYLALTMREHPKFFAANLICSIFGVAPTVTLLGVGLRILIAIIAGVEYNEDRYIIFIMPRVIMIAISATACMAFPVYYVATRWQRVSRSLYLGLIGIGILICFVMTISLIDFVIMIS